MKDRYAPKYGTPLEMLSRLRTEEWLAAPEKRRDFWREALNGEVLALLADGNMREAEEKIRNAAGRFGTQS